MSNTITAASDITDGWSSQMYKHKSVLNGEGKSIRQNKKRLRSKDRGNQLFHWADAVSAGGNVVVPSTVLGETVRHQQHLFSWYELLYSYYMFN